MAERLVGTDIAPPDLRAKITGRARYAEDFRAPGMVFMKLLLSPMPHCRVRNVDASRALALPGVLDIMRADEVAEPSERPSESMLTDEPKYEGEPILAVAAVDEETAGCGDRADRARPRAATVRSRPDRQPPSGWANAYTDGNQFSGQDGWSEYKWSQADIDLAEAGEMPDPQDMPVEWEKGDVDAAMAAADHIVYEPIVHQSLTHHPWSPAPRWRTGRTDVRSRSSPRRVPSARRWACRVLWMWIRRR